MEEETSLGSSSVTTPMKPTPHPVDLLDEDPATVPLSAQGIGAGHVRRQHGECRIGKNPPFEVAETMVELVHP